MHRPDCVALAGGRIDNGDEIRSNLKNDALGGYVSIFNVRYGFIASIGRCIALLLLVMQIGCATEKERFTGLVPPPPGRAVIYIYRVDLDYSAGSVRSHLAPDIMMNGDFLEPLREGGYLRVVVYPGAVELAIPNNHRTDDARWHAAGNAVVKLNASPGSTQFVQFTLDRMFSFR
jgi:hypothetical protein